MQEGYHDYSEGERNSGCCLDCDDSHDGCLCYDCKCKNCFWYSSQEDTQSEKGHCDKTDSLKGKKEEKWLNNYSKNIKEKRLRENKGQTELRDFKNE